jgi:putative endonuclease
MNGRIGQCGERLAGRYLEEHGHRVLARNLRIGRLGELDLVTLDGDGRTLCFVEVKTRTGEGFGQPAEAVTADKRRRIRTMANLFLQRQAWADVPVVDDPPVRFDVMEVWLDRQSKSARVHHIPQAF